jgi:1,4-dihydroxy-2-naphthoate octaprenyltransferase
MKGKIKTHLWTLGRWFALPFFGVSVLIGVVLAGGSLTSPNTWLAFVAVALAMAGGHSFNTYLDTTWTKLDIDESHSVEKGYAAGSVVISEGWASEKEVLINALGWYALAIIPGVWLAVAVTPWILIPFIYGMAVTFIYCWSKFSYFHEVVLASGPVAAAVIGALSTGIGEWANALLVSIPIVLIFSYAGLALDEWPDAKANLGKGVKSLAYKVWEYGYDLPTYIMLWCFTAFLVQLFFIVIGILKPLTALTLIILPPAIGASIFLKKEQTFKKAALVIVFVAMWFPILLLIGELLGG